jgi:myo-inositol-1(or 4)-monophosphatase
MPFNVPAHALGLGDDMSVALRAAARAGAEILQGYGKLHQVGEKGVGDLACEVDVAADIAILGELKGSRPGDSLVSEELVPSSKDPGGRCWVVDPLDATSAFIFQTSRALPSVLVALREEGETQLGVVFFPLTNEWFYAVRGVGSYKDGVRLSTARHTTSLSSAWVDMNHYGDAQLETELFASLRKSLRSSNGARLVTSQVPHSGIVARIAEGEQKISAVIHDNNWKKVKQAPWDTSATQIILEEAGGVFLNLMGERYDPFRPEPIIAAASRDLAIQIILTLKDDRWMSGNGEIHAVGKFGDGYSG